ncbi:hypothetical protein [Burkholderia sp. BCC0044]|uniref:hypothetical protein n=1 Tax=Burkholderia sp. BCC0044 TaxID=2676295 RepID=UPI00158DF232|nr:hypothetical protein [Burkholderia sp. BCC0044]
MTDAARGMVASHPVPLLFMPYRLLPMRGRAAFRHRLPSGHVSTLRAASRLSPAVSTSLTMRFSPLAENQIQTCPIAET